jgi:hypothetical protein
MTRKQTLLTAPVYKWDSVHKGGIGVGSQRGHKAATVQRVTRCLGLLRLCPDGNTSRDSCWRPPFRPPNSNYTRVYLPACGQWMVGRHANPGPPL